jgi:hypothetical protein
VKYYLVVYDQRAATLRSIEEFDESERGQASEARFALEARHRDEPEVEIVVLGSASLATLKKTHGRYFKSVGELASEA